MKRIALLTIALICIGNLYMIIHLTIIEQVFSTIANIGLLVVFAPMLVIIILMACAKVDDCLGWKFIYFVSNLQN